MLNRFGHDAGQGDGLDPAQDAELRVRIAVG